MRPPDHHHRIPSEDGVFNVDARESGRRSSRHADGLCQPVSSIVKPVAIPQLQNLIERFRKVLLSGGNGPVASADGGVATGATVELVLAIRDAVADLWKAHEVEIKQRCGPWMPQGLIAKQEVFGFALADALGRPLLPGDRAMQVGQNGDNAVRWAEGSKDRKGKLTLAREAASAAVRKARRAAAKDASLESAVAAAEEDGKQAIATVLAKAVDLNLPNETVGAVKRKRGTPSELTVPAEPTLEALRAAARKARGTFDARQAVQSAAGLRSKRALQRWNDVCDRVPDEPDYRPVPPFGNEDDYEDDPSGYVDAFEEWRDACNKDLKKAMAAVTKWQEAFNAANAALSAARMEWEASCEALSDARIALNDAERALSEAEWREADDAVRATDAKIARIELALKELGRCTCKECASASV